MSTEEGPFSLSKHHPPLPMDSLARVLTGRMVRALTVTERAWL